MKNASKTTILTLISILLLAGVASAEIVDFNFHWAPSPAYDDHEGALSIAVHYEVWMKAGSAPEVLLAAENADTNFVFFAESGIVQRLRVRGVDASGRMSEMSEWSDPLYFEEGRAGDTLPSVAELRSNYPNPFNPETRIVYGIPESIEESSTARLDIYNIAGMRVRTLEVDRTPGWHELTWDGTNDRGQTQATGMYVTKFTVGAMVSTNKMTMVK